jgi:hypothetical protein
MDFASQISDLRTIHIPGVTVCVVSIFGFVVDVKYEKSQEHTLILQLRVVLRDAGQYEYS